MISGPFERKATANRSTVYSTIEVQAASKLVGLMRAANKPPSGPAGFLQPLEVLELFRYPGT